MSNLPAQVSKWEIAGIPAAAILEVLYEMETLPEALKNDLPRYMLLLFIAVATIRALQQRKTESPATTTKTE